MAAGFLIVLVLAWTAVCVSAAYRARHREPVVSAALFKRGLELIGPAHHREFLRTYGRPVTVGAPANRLSVRHGRLVVFLGLAVGVFVTLAGGFVEGAWEAHLAFDATLALFVAWLIEDKHRRHVKRRRIRAIQRRQVGSLAGGRGAVKRESSYPGELRRAAGDA